MPSFSLQQSARHREHRQRQETHTAKEEPHAEDTEERRGNKNLTPYLCVTRQPRPSPRLGRRVCAKNPLRVRYADHLTVPWLALLSYLAKKPHNFSETR